MHICDTDNVIEYAANCKSHELNLADRAMKFVPLKTFELIDLKTLDLRNNNLKNIPKEIGKLENLQTLYLYRNQLTDLPDEIGELKNLKSLHVSNNKLEYLPTTIRNLTNLNSLDLRNNNLTALPMDFEYLSNLSFLDLQDNPLIFPPIELLSQTPAAILSFLRKYRSKADDGALLNEAKMLLVGQGGVGKSSLLKRLVHDTFDSDESTTKGIKIDKFIFNSPEDPKSEIILNAWDFGGQEIYHATHQFFLTHRSLYLLVWDARQEEEYGRIDYWLNTIESFSGESPVIIVLNKIDERSKEINLRDLKIRFPQIVGYYKVSAKTGQGIKKVKEAIKKTATKLPLMGTYWLRSWLSIRNLLERYKRKYMSFDVYLKICAGNGIQEIEAKSLSQYLHDLGIILHFQNDFLLKNLIILKPDWGTSAVYRILDSELVQKRKGLLLNTDLPNIWTDRKEYPHAQHPAMMRLMNNFELAFPFEEGERHIVAELLPIEEVSYRWNSLNNLRFEYHYDFLPAGIMTRFIVRIHDFLRRKKGDNLCWRDGALLKNNGTSALVKLIASHKMIAINVSGRFPKDFLIIIRHHFDKIHRTIKKVRVHEMIPCNCEPNCDYRYDYQVLLRRENKNISHERCGNTDKTIEIISLLDGIEEAINRKTRYEILMKEKELKVSPINISNTIDVSPEIYVTSEAKVSATFEVNVDFPKDLQTIQDELFNLKSIIDRSYPAESKEIDIIDNAILDIDPTVTESEKIEKKYFKRLGRFLRMLNNSNNEINKFFLKSQSTIKSIKNLCRAYNNIAQWISLPIIPDLFVK